MFEYSVNIEQVKKINNVNGLNFLQQIADMASTVHVHRAAVTWIPKVRWTFDEIAKMSPGGARTHDPAATLSKLQPNLGIQVTAARCS